MKFLAPYGEMLFFNLFCWLTVAEHKPRWAGRQVILGLYQH